MTDSLAFDDDVARRFDWFYAAGDVKRRRRKVLAALAAEPGERIVDVGCGPGFYVAEVAEAVGRSGTIVGIDPSRTMLGAAARRTEGLQQVTLLEGEATRIPIETGTQDAAISVQVLEYVPEVDAALAELRRVVRPGGRIVIWDVDWSTVSWHSSDPVLMRRVLRAWDQHLFDPALPRTLAARLRKAGFVDVEAEGHAFVNTEANENAYSTGVIDFVADFVPGRDGVTAEDVAAWKEDLLRLSDSGDYYFACMQFGFSATRA